MFTKSPLFTAPPIQYPQLIKDPALGWYLPFLAKVPPWNHHQEEMQVIDLIVEIHNLHHPIPVIACILTYLVHLEIPLPRVTDIGEDTVLCMMQWHARFIKINLRYLGVDINKLPEGRSHFLFGTFYKGERMIKWIEVQGYPILKDTLVDYNHYLTHNKGYKILNIYDDELPQIWAYQDSCWHDMPLTGVYAKTYPSKNGPFLSMFPWIKDTDFYPIIRNRFDDRSLNFQTESIARDRLHRWFRRDQRVDVPTICQWNTAFDT